MKLCITFTKREYVQVTDYIEQNLSEANSLQLSNTFSAFCGTKHSISVCLEEFPTGTYPEIDKSDPRHYCLFLRLILMISCIYV